MNLAKKALSFGTSAVLVASLLATAAVPAALADTSVSGTVSVPVGGTSSGTTLALTFNDASTKTGTILTTGTTTGFCAVTADGAHSATLTYTIKDSAGHATVSFTGTPTFAPGLPSSLGASVALTQSSTVTGTANDSFTVTIAGCDPNNVEQFTVTGLQIAASSSAATGTISGSLSDNDAGAFVGAITGTTTTATGTLQAAITGTAGGAFNINVTSTCPFVVGPNGLATTANFADISDARSITGVGAVVGNIQTVTFGTGLYGHAITTVVTQTVPVCSAFASPGTVGAVVTQGAALQKATQQQVNPGQQNQLAGTTTITEPSAGFLAAASTVTFKISAAGVLFSSPPSVFVAPGTQLATPAITSVTGASGGGTVAAGAYCFEVAALVTTPAQHTASTSPQCATVPSGGGSVSLLWTALTGATGGYNVYEAATSAGPFYALNAPTANPHAGTTLTLTAPITNDGATLAPTTNNTGLTVGAVSLTSQLNTGGTLVPTDIYYFKVTALNAAGESLPSAASNIAVASAQNSILVGWTAVPGATSYNVYEGISAAGVTLLANVATNSYLALAISSSATTPPTVDGTVLTTPVGLAASAAANSGTLANGTYYYVVQAIDAAGHSFSSAAFSGVATSGAVTVNWGAVAGATSYNVYGRPASSGGTYGLLANVSTNSYTDAGTPATPGAAPVNTNTSAGTPLTLTSGLCALSFDRTSCTVTVNTASVGAGSSFTVGNATSPYVGAIRVDVASTVPYGTAVNLNVTEAPAVTTSVTSSTIAYVAQGLLAVSVQAVPTVYMDYNAQPSGVITVSESMPGFFQAGSSGNNTLTLCTDGYETFTFAPYAIVTAGDVSLLNTSTYVGTTSAQSTLNPAATCATWYVFSASTKASTISIVGANASGALSATVATDGPTLSVATNAPVGPVLMTVTSGTTSTTLYSKQVSNAVRAFKSGGTVTAVAQPYLRPGTTNAAGGVTIAETLNGQLLAGEQITCTVLPNPLNEVQQTYLATENANNLPVVTTGGGMLAHLVGTTSTSFTVAVDQQAFAPSFGSINVGNLWFTTISGATTGPVTLECMNGTQYTGSTTVYGTITSTVGVASLAPITTGFVKCFDITGTGFVPGVATIDAGASNQESVTLVADLTSCTSVATGHQEFDVFLANPHAAGAPITETIGTGSSFMTGTAFDQFVSNAIVGVPSKLNIAANSALGLNPTSGYTMITPKYQAVGKYVTWKFTGGMALAGQRVNILVAKHINGAWGGPVYLKSAWADANGIVSFAWTSKTAAAINVRVQWPGNLSYAVSVSKALGAYYK